MLRFRFFRTFAAPISSFIAPVVLKEAQDGGIWEFPG